MADIGNINSTLLQSQNVLVMTADTDAEAVANDLIPSLTFAQIEGERPETRSNYGTSKRYHYASPDRAFYFIAGGNDALVQYLNSRFVENDRNVPQSFPWEIRATPNVGNPRIIRFDGPLITNRFLGTVENQGEVASVEARIRVPGVFTMT